MAGWQKNFDRLLKAMSQGEPPKAGKRSPPKHDEGPKEAEEGER